MRLGGTYITNDRFVFLGGVSWEELPDDKNGSNDDENRNDNFDAAWHLQCNSQSHLKDLRNEVVVCQG